MRSFSKQRLYANAMPAAVVLCGCISTSNKIIEACLLQRLGLNDCVCFRSLIESTLYFIMTFLNTHKTSSPADQMSANWEFFLFLSFPFSFLLSPFFSFCFTCFTLLFLLCLAAFIQHLKQFLSFHLMEAEGRQIDAIIKHALYNSRAALALLVVTQLPTGLMSLFPSWVTSPGTFARVGPEILAQYHIF